MGTSRTTTSSAALGQHDAPHKHDDEQYDDEQVCHPMASNSASVTRCRAELDNFGTNPN